jgi:cellulose synthase/poly-beta-1,6-N-acetylglucosamine synthase-like glycosyltransferase
MVGWECPTNPREASGLGPEAVHPLSQRVAVEVWRRVSDGAVEEGDPVVDVAAADPGFRPTIDVLVPAYREGNVVDHAVASLRRTAYPQDRLRVTVLVEPGDDEMRGALDELAAWYDSDAVVVPEDYPGTPNKPRALNYGFEVTDGDVVGVVDAEDVVDPDLFGHVVAGLVGEGRDYVQGRLDMVNESDGWRNLLFRGEYGFWFEYLLPAYYYAGYPIPLGGTTNFFRRATLEAASEIRLERYGTPWPDGSEEWFRSHGLAGTAPWDPRNVTEDFELGLLLWSASFDVGYLSVSTREESPVTLDGWIRQRTRWQKGKVYTLFQWLRVPPRGAAAKLHFTMQSFTPHLGPMNVVGVVVIFVYGVSAQVTYEPVVALVLLLCLSFVGLFSLAHAAAYWTVSDYPVSARKVGRFAVSLTTLPAYWVLQWGADVRALWQVYLGQNHWEKTPHHGRHVVGEDGDGPIRGHRRPERGSAETAAPPRNAARPPPRGGDT